LAIAPAGLPRRAFWCGAKRIAKRRAFTAIRVMLRSGNGNNTLKNQLILAKTTEFCRFSAVNELI
jgi:hypothetical protein